MTTDDRGNAPQTVERGDIFFTADGGAELPLPFEVAARTVRLAPGTEPKALVLGWGLGAMADRMATIRPEVQLVGVELSHPLVKRARQHLPKGATLHQADALEWLKKSRRRFDFILDDCFVLRGTETYRPRTLRTHAPLIERRLAERGIYVRNLLVDQLDEVAGQITDLYGAFPVVETRHFREWDNVFAIASRYPLVSNWRSLLER